MILVDRAELSASTSLLRDPTERDVRNVGVAGVLLERWRRSDAGSADSCDCLETPPGKAVTCNTKWLKNAPGEVYETICGPEGHKVRIEPGPGGNNAAPMQILLPAAACCSATGVLAKLQEAGITVDGLEIKTAATRSTPAQHRQPDLPASVFTTMEMEVIITSADADEVVVDEIVRNHNCSVVSNMKRTTRLTKSSVVKRK